MSKIAKFALFGLCCILCEAVRRPSYSTVELRLSRLEAALGRTQTRKQRDKTILSVARIAREICSEHGFAALYALQHDDSSETSTTSCIWPEQMRRVFKAAVRLSTRKQAALLGDCTRGDGGEDPIFQDAMTLAAVRAGAKVDLSHLLVKIQALEAVALQVSSKDFERTVPPQYRDSLCDWFADRVADQGTIDSSLLSFFEMNISTSSAMTGVRQQDGFFQSSCKGVLQAGKDFAMWPPMQIINRDKVKLLSFFLKSSWRDIGDVIPPGEVSPLSASETMWQERTSPLWGASSWPGTNNLTLLHHFAYVDNHEALGVIRELACHKGTWDVVRGARDAVGRTAAHVASRNFNERSAGVLQADCGKQVVLPARKRSASAYTSQLTSGGWDPTVDMSVVQDNICELAEVDAALFGLEKWRELADQPFVIRGGALGTSGFNYWRERLNISKLLRESLKVQIGGIAYEQEQKLSGSARTGVQTPLKTYVEQMIARRNQSFSEFAAQLQGGKNLDPTAFKYVFQDISPTGRGRQFFRGCGANCWLCPFDRAGESPSPLCFRPYTDCTLGIGATGSGAQLHFHSDTFNVNIFGAKRWFFNPPVRGGRSSSLIAHSFLHEMHDSQLFPRSATCVQWPGDIVVFPNGWMHGTLNAAEGVAITFEQPWYYNMQSAAEHTMSDTQIQQIVYKDRRKQSKSWTAGKTGRVSTRARTKEGKRAASHHRRSAHGRKRGRDDL